MKNFSIAALLLLFSLSACSVSKKNTSEANLSHSSIEGNWTLKEMKKSTIDPNDFNKIPKLEMNLTENKFSGNDGCNSYGGNLQNVTTEKITFIDMYSTEMYCDKMKATEEYVSLLQKAMAYKIEKMNLYLSDNTGQLLLTFYKEE